MKIKWKNAKTIWVFAGVMFVSNLAWTIFLSIFVVIAFSISLGLSAKGGLPETVFLILFLLYFLPAIVSSLIIHSLDGQSWKITLKYILIALGIFLLQDGIFLLKLIL